MLPKKNGIDVLRTLRSTTGSNQNTPVFLITNLGQKNIISEAYKIGVDEFILKARILPEELVQRINNFFAV